MEAFLFRSRNIGGNVCLGTALTQTGYLLHRFKQQMLQQQKKFLGLLFFQSILAFLKSKRTGKISFRFFVLMHLKGAALCPFLSDPGIPGSNILVWMSVSNTPFADLTDVTLADDDNSLIPTFTPRKASKSCQFWYLAGKSSKRKVLDNKC